MKETFADRFSRLLLTERGLRIEDVASTMRAGADAVRRIADGRTKQPRFDEMLRLCEAYDIDPYLLAFGRSMRPISDALSESEARLPGELGRILGQMQQEIRTAVEVAKKALETAEEAKSLRRRPGRRSA